MACVQVLMGADKKVDVIIQAPDGNIVDQHRWTSTGMTDRFIVLPGFTADNNITFSFNSFNDSWSKLLLFKGSSAILV